MGLREKIVDAFWGIVYGVEPQDERSVLRRKNRDIEERLNGHACLRDERIGLITIAPIATVVVNECLVHTNIPHVILPGGDTSGVQQVAFLRADGETARVLALLSRMYTEIRGEPTLESNSDGRGQRDIAKKMVEARAVVDGCRKRGISYFKDAYLRNVMDQAHSLCEQADVFATQHDLVSRIEMAATGQNLDILCADPEPLVRATMVAFGQMMPQLSLDIDTRVRKLVACQGCELENLSRDRVREVSEVADHYLNGWFKVGDTGHVFERLLCDFLGHMTEPSIEFETLESLYNSIVCSNDQHRDHSSFEDTLYNATRRSAELAVFSGMHREEEFEFGY